MMMLEGEKQSIRWQQHPASSTWRNHKHINCLVDDITAMLAVNTYDSLMMLRVRRGMPTAAVFLKV